MTALTELYDRAAEAPSGMLFRVAVLDWMREVTRLEEQRALPHPGNLLDADTEVPWPVRERAA